MLDGALLTAADLDARVEAFESAWAKNGSTELERFLPPPSDPEYLPVLVELVRIDLEIRYGRGEPARLERYRSSFPTLFTDRSRLAEVAYEEYRLRAAAGESPSTWDYAARYGIDTFGWPMPSVLPATAVVAIAETPPVWTIPTGFPRPGDSVLDFRVVRELGRGSFGRVYLAEQIDLAGRLVVVKLTTRFGKAEPDTLARLQHANIVPVYSTHRAGGFQVLVMPYLGDTTLADILTALRGRSVWPASGRELVTTLIDRHSKTVSDSSTPHVPEPPRPGVSVEGLARFTYPDAILWIGARLAEALAHAHDRGIKHLDVKPANVLLTDDGQPMLLDFNLAADAAQTGDKKTGGTPGYMAPEQLLALKGEPSTIDARADIFGLGVVLFELLTGRHPYPLPSASTADPLCDLLASRQTAPPRLQAINPLVTPSTDEIVRRCLESDPARRYQSAAALAEDLSNHLANRPLVHTREPSVRERFRKWRKRHPRLSSSGTVAMLAAGIIMTVALTAYTWKQRANRLDREANATQAYASFRNDVDEANTQLVLATWTKQNPSQKVATIQRIRTLLSQYDAADDPEWGNRASIADLSAENRRDLRHLLTDLLAMYYMGEWARIESKRPTATIAEWNELFSLNDRVVLAYQNGHPVNAELVPKTIWSSRARLLDRLGRADEGRQARVAATQSPKAAHDEYLLGLTYLNEGEIGKALVELEKATRADSQHFLAWLTRGVTYAAAGQEREAEWCAQVCISLRPDLAVGYYNRGLSRLRLKRYESAIEDFTMVLTVHPDHTDALIGRAQAQFERGQPKEAIPDLDRAMELGSGTPRVYFRRAEAREVIDDKAGAAADRKAGLAIEPTDDSEWVERGMVRAAAGDAAGALDDFDSALRLNPRSFEALQNKANVLDEKLQRPGEAILVLDRAIEWYPDAVLARAGRAVLLARRGQTAAAYADVDRLLLRAEPNILYQLAGVYAQTSKTHPDDAKTALRLLAAALQQGYGFEYVEDGKMDPDLEPIRGTPEFRTLVDSAKAARRDKK